MKRTAAWRKSGRIVAIVILVVSVCGFFSWSVNRIFTIRNIEVSGDGIQVEVNKNSFPKNLLFFPADTLKVQILKNYPLVASVTLKKKYPGTLVITAIPRKPFAASGVGSEMYLLDKEGVVLEQYPINTGLPLIHIAVPPTQPGATISDPAITAALDFLRESASLVTISDVMKVDSSSLRAQTESMSIVFAQQSDIPIFARTLQMMMSGFRIKGKLPATIDLRFDKPVVTF